MLTKRIIPCLDVDLDQDRDAAVAASIFHFDVYSIEEIKEYLDDHGVPVRP